MGNDWTRERRRNHRFAVSASALVFLEGVELGQFAVDNLSVTGALFTGDMGALAGDRVTVLLSIEDYPDIEVDGRIVRVSRAHGLVRMAVELEHWSGATEDALREALLGARSRSELPPPPAEQPFLEPWEVDDPDLFEIIPPPR